MNARIAELGVAFQHCEFFFQFSKNISGFEFFSHLFYNFISEKRWTFFFKNLSDILSQLGNDYTRGVASVNPNKLEECVTIRIW